MWLVKLTGLGVLQHRLHRHNLVAELAGGLGGSCQRVAAGRGGWVGGEERRGVWVIEPGSCSPYRASWDNQMLHSERLHMQEEDDVACRQAAERSSPAGCKLVLRLARHAVLGGHVLTGDACMGSG